MKKRISVTMLCSYIYCKRKLFLERVLGLFEPEKEALVKGTIRHHTYDKVNEIEKDIVCSITEKDNFETIYQKYIGAYAKLLRKSIVANKYRLAKVKLPLIDAYHQIIPILTKAIQEQHTIIEKQKAENTLMKEWICKQNDAPEALCL